MNTNENETPASSAGVSVLASRWVIAFWLQGFGRDCDHGFSIRSCGSIAGLPKNLSRNHSATDCVIIAARDI